MVYYEQRDYILLLQKKLEEEMELRKQFERKADIFKFGELEMLEAGSDEYVLAKMAKDLEMKSEECEVIVKEKSQEIHELKVSLDSQQAIICDQRNIIVENEKEIRDLNVKLEKLTESSLANAEKDTTYLTEISELKMRLRGFEEINDRIKCSKDTKRIIENLRGIIQDKNEEIENILEGCKSQQNNFQKTLNQQLEEIDAKNQIIEDLRATTKSYEERVQRLKQATCGIKSSSKDAEIDQKLRVEISLRKSLTASRQENKILEDNLIDAKLQWANCEHQAASMKMDLVDMSEEIQYLRQKLTQYENP